MIRRCLLGLLVITSNWCLADDIYVRLNPEVTLDHLDVKLGDVATVIPDAKNSRLSERFLREPIVSLDSLVTPVRLSRQEIERMLVVRRPEIQKTIIWGGVDSVLIYGKKQTVNLAPWIDNLAAELLQRATFQESAVELKLMNNKIELMDVPMGRVEARPIYGQAHRQNNDIRIPMSILVDGKFYAKPIVHFKARPVPVQDESVSASRPRSRGQDAKHARLPAASVRATAGGESLPGPHQENDFLIKKNQQVRIIFREQAIQIETAGIALTNAQAGDKAKVRRMDGQDILVGRALAPDMIVVGDD